MFDLNSGYVGARRSVRSQEAVASYEIPISMINKKIIEDFLTDNESEFSDEELQFLKKLSVAKWKYIMKTSAASSWHHTSSFFNKTNHYNLIEISKTILESKEIINDDYKEFLKRNMSSEVELKKKADKKQSKNEINDKKLLFKYQKKYKTLGGFLRSNSDFKALKEIRINAIHAKREELLKLWENQLPKEHRVWKDINNDDFIESYIK